MEWIWVWESAGLKLDRVQDQNTQKFILVFICVTGLYVGYNVELLYSTLESYQAQEKISLV